MNTRANIMYFIEHFLDQASREGQPDYVRMMQRDIIRVVDAVAPDDGSGAANVKVVRKVSTTHSPYRLDAILMLHRSSVRCKVKDSSTIKSQRRLKMLLKSAGPRTVTLGFHLLWKMPNSRSKPRNNFQASKPSG